MKLGSTSTFYYALFYFQRKFRQTRRRRQPSCRLYHLQQQQQQTTPAPGAEASPPTRAVYSTWRLNECRAKMPFCRPISEQLEAPLVVIGVGSSLAVVGTVPVVITLSLGINTSATIIGVGFIGFGFLIILPGICWCLVSHLSYSYRFWRHPATTRTCADLEEALVLRSVTQYSLIIAHQHRSIRFVPKQRIKMIIIINITRL